MRSSLVVAEGINFAPKKCNGVSSCLVSPLLVEDVFDIASRSFLILFSFSFDIFSFSFSFRMSENRKIIHCLVMTLFLRVRTYVNYVCSSNKRGYKNAYEIRLGFFTYTLYPFHIQKNIRSELYKTRTYVRTLYYV